MTSQEAVDIIRESLAQMNPLEQDPRFIMRRIVKDAIYGRNSLDNVTMMVILLKCSIGYGD